MTYIHTYSGKKFSLLDPQPEDICVKDIAHHLSLLCRFNGASDRFYSVAQHCVLAKEIAFEPEALFHDAGEAYYGDISSPLKAILQDIAGEAFTTLLEKVDRVIFERFGLIWPLEPKIKAVDDQLFTLEWHHFMFGSTTKTVRGVPDLQITAWSSFEAEVHFQTEALRFGIK